MDYPTPDIVDCRKCGHRMASYPDMPSTVCDDCCEKKWRKDEAAARKRQKTIAVRKERERKDKRNLADLKRKLKKLREENKLLKKELEQYK